MAFCQWLSDKTGQTCTLPTEAQWEKAARGPKGSKYPWGNTLNPPGRSGNYADSSAGSNLPVILANYTDGYAAAAPVGTFAANTAGLYDLGGNVREWWLDWYSPKYYASSERVNPMGPRSGERRVVRGGEFSFGAWMPFPPLLLTELRKATTD